MHPEDSKRLRCEIDLFRATRGPDYSMRDRDVAAEKAHVQRGQAAAADAAKRYRAALAAGELDEGQDI